MRFAMLLVGLLLLSACAAGGNTKTQSAASRGLLDSCSMDPAPLIDIHFEIKDAPVDRSIGYRTLTKQKRQITEANQSAYLIGILDIEADITGNAQLQGYQMTNGHVCTWAEKVDIPVNWQEKTYIASEVIPDSCIDQALRRYLKKVEEDAITTQDAVRETLTKALRDPSSKVVEAETSDLATQKFSSGIQQVVNQAAVEEGKKLQDRLNVFMSPTQFHEVESACGKQALQAVLAQ